MSDPQPDRLPRALGFWSAVAVLVGTTIGSGIFRVPASVAATLADPGPMFLVWVLGGVIALAGALSIAELAAAIPRSGGIFAWLLECYGPLPAFLFGWAELAVVRAAALGATATIFAEYLGFFIPLSEAQVHYVAATMIVVLGLLNMVGISRAAAVMNFATFVKAVALVMLALLALATAGGATQPAAPSPMSGFDGGLRLSLIATALIPVMWTYDGWADLGFVAGEVRDPGRTLPRALILGTALVTLVYLLVNLALVHAMSVGEMARAPLIAAGLAERVPLLSGIGTALVVALVLVSTFSGLNGSMMTGPRIFFAMAEQGLFLARLAYVSPRFRTPLAAIGLATVLGVAYVLQNDFAGLADRFILGIWPFYALAVLGVLVLRGRQPGLQRPYRTWGYPAVPLIFLAASGLLMANALLTDPAGTGVTLAIIAAGLPVYWFWKAKRGGSS